METGQQAGRSPGGLLAWYIFLIRWDFHFEFLSSDFLEHLASLHLLQALARLLAQNEQLQQFV